MNTGYIGSEYRLTENESLVHLLVKEAEDDPRHYVAVAIHPPGKPVTFTEAERVSAAEAPGVFAHRAFFNGRNAKSVVNKLNVAELGVLKIQIA